MNDPTGAVPGPRLRKRFILGAVVVLASTVIALLLSSRGNEPSYLGRRASQWFKDAVELATYDEADQFPCADAFREMEGAAVPLLIAKATTRSSRLQLAYARAYPGLVARLPRAISVRMPAPSLGRDRRLMAVRLLGVIGARQRWKVVEGQPAIGPSATTALPAIRAALREPSPLVQHAAAHAAQQLGTGAVTALPELMALVRDDSDGLAMEAIGAIGPSACEAVPLLMTIAADPARPNRQVAIRSLGSLGPCAAAAAGVLAQILRESVPALRIEAARSLAEIGAVPQEAVEPLTRMLKSDDSWASCIATLALWNQDRGDLGLRKRVALELDSKHRCALALSLASMGTNATLFVPELSRMAENADPQVRHAARLALRAAQSLPL